ncbi:MAG TPA: hypothetical protein VLO11_00705 [Luteolibacter sp.]|nr:hypothetical protein [Luteolibacter sp.]
MDTPRTDNFNERLSQWVASQGFWFQVRYSMSGSGVKGRAMFHLLRLGFRLLIFLMVAALGVTVYLMKRTDSEKFVENFGGKLETALSAEDLEIRGVQHVQGQLEIGRLAAEGGASTFFDSLEARNIRMKMNLLDGLVGVWNTGNIAIARLEADLRAGTDDEASARDLAKAVFGKSQRVDVHSIEIASATLHWGYSEQTRGSIENSEMRVQRTDAGWRLSFKKGVFRQNWLRQLDIVEMVVLVESGGLLFERAEFKQSGGTVEFPGLRVMAGARPQVDGIVKVRDANLASVLPPALLNFMDGSLSGDFRAFGSTNSSEGVGFEGQVVLDGRDTISLRDRIHILKALSVVDYSRNYRRVDFNAGSFDMRTHAGGMRLTDIDLQAEDLLTISGQLEIRLPTQQEVDAAVAEGSGLESSPLFISEDEIAEARGLQGDDGEDFTLRRAAQEARRIQEGNQSAESLSLFDRLGIGIEMRRLRNQAADRMSRMLRYEGELEITLPGDAFERAPRLAEMYPTDPATGRHTMKVPVEGHLYELTLRQAEDIYQLGQR